MEAYQARAPILGLSLSNITGTCQKGMSLANIREESGRPSFASRFRWMPKLLRLDGGTRAADIRVLNRLSGKILYRACLEEFQGDAFAPAMAATCQE